MLQLDFGDMPDKLKEQYLAHVRTYTVRNIKYHKI